MSLTISGSASSLQIPVWKIYEERPTKSTIVKCGGSDSDVVQIFGRQNWTFIIEGITRNLDDKLFIDSLAGQSGSISFQSAFNLIDTSLKDFTLSLMADFDDSFNEDFFHGLSSVPINYVPVYYMSVKWYDTGKRAMEHKFTIEMRQVGVY